MRTILLVSTLTLAWTLGCGSDDHAQNIDEAIGGSSGEGGESSKGGKGGGSSTAGSATDDGGAAGDASGGEATDGGTNSEGGQTGGGSGGDQGGGSAGQAGSSADLAPIVTILTPDEASDPNSDPVIVSDTVEVQCQATAASDTATVDTGSIALTMTQVAAGLGPVSSELDANLLTSTFDLSELESGTLVFNCQAQDRSTPVNVGRFARSVLVDRGPLVEITQPAADQFVPLKDSYDVRFTVNPAPLSDDDENAAIAEVTFKANGDAIEPAAPENLEGQFTATLDLTKTSLFPVSSDPYTVAGLVVTAKNARGAVREVSQSFKIDGVAPTIAITSPTSPSIMGESITVTFTVTDGGAGVDPETVKVILSSRYEFTFDAAQTSRWSTSGDSYTFTFNATEILGTSQANVVVQVTAKDLVGNANDDGTSIILDLDQHPPIISLDPPTMRERRPFTVNDVEVLVCSNAFDPLGDAVSDYAVVDNVETFRALVWDDTNIVSGATPYYAFTDPTKVWLYLGKETGSDVNLYQDSDGDGACDSLTTGGLLPAIQLQPVAPTGIGPWISAEDFASYDDTRYSTDTPGLVDCLTAGWDLEAAPTTFLCDESSDMVRAIGHAASSSESVVYAIAPASPECTGHSLDLGGLFYDTSTAEFLEGWHCAAVKAVDNVGNGSVSPPIRLCYDNPDTDYVPDCAVDKIAITPESQWLSYIRNTTVYQSASPDSAPSCIADCTLPTKVLDTYLESTIGRVWQE